MINFNFKYVKPTSIEQAVEVFQQTRLKAEKAMYISGGTEFISRARMNEIDVDVVIDLKSIPECNVLEVKNEKLIIGATKTLTDVAESKLFLLLSNVIRSIATRTERNKITIGGNLTSNLPYKEAVLPFLLADSKLIVATEKGLQEKLITDVFSNKIKLEDEQFIVQIITDINLVEHPFYNEKKTKQSKVNYPILTLASLKVDEKIRFAVSGVCNFPFRLEEMEKQVNDKEVSLGKRIEKMITLLPAPVTDDMHASAKYREFVFRTTCTKMLEQMERMAK